MDDERIAGVLELFELPDSFTEDDLKRAYRDLLQVWHPEKFLHSERLRAKAEAKTKTINAGYEILRASLVDGRFTFRRQADTSSHGGGYRGTQPPPKDRPPPRPAPTSGSHRTASETGGPSPGAGPDSGANSRRAGQAPTATPGEAAGAPRTGFVPAWVVVPLLLSVWALFMISFPGTSTKMGTRGDLLPGLEESKKNPPPTAAAADANAQLPSGVIDFRPHTPISTQSQVINLTQDPPKDQVEQARQDLNTPVLTDSAQVAIQSVPPSNIVSAVDMEAAIGPAFSLLAEAQTVGVYVDTFIVKTSGAFKYGVPANLYTVRQSLDGFLFPVPPATHSDPVVANHLAALLNARLGKKKVEIVVFRGRGEKTLKFKVPKSLAEHETKNQ